MEVRAAGVLHIVYFCYHLSCAHCATRCSRRWKRLAAVSWIGNFASLVVKHHFHGKCYFVTLTHGTMIFTIHIKYPSICLQPRLSYKQSSILSSSRSLISWPNHSTLSITLYIFNLRLVLFLCKKDNKVHQSSKHWEDLLYLSRPSLNEILV